ATNFQLNVTTNQIDQTWTVTAVASDTQLLGLVSWSIDVDGIGGVSVLKSSVASMTNQTPSVFSQFRTTGTISGTNLVQIQASQDLISAVDNNNDSVLQYGYAFTGTANGQFTSNNYGVPGPVAGLGPITLATGQYTGSIFLDGPGGIVAT